MLPINETMGQYSELFMLLAAGTYTVAFIAFAWDLAKSSKTLRAVDLKAAELSGADAARVPVAAGVGCFLPVLLTGPTGTWPGPWAGPSARRRPWRVVASAGIGQTADGAMRYSAERRVPARVAVALTVLGAAIHAAGVITRAIGAGRVPWGNMYEFLTTGAFVAVAVFLLVLIRRDLRFLGTFVVGLAIIMLVAASVAYWTPVGAPGSRAAELLADHPRLDRRAVLRAVHPDLRDVRAAAGPVAPAEDHRCRRRRQAGLHAPRPVRAEPREPLLPDQRDRVRRLDLHADVRRHLGREGLGPLLGLGHQGSLDAS